MVPFNSHFIKEYNTVWSNGKNQLLHLSKGFDLLSSAFINILNANSGFADRIMLGCASGYKKETGNPII